MKNYFLILISVLLISFSSCEKEEIINDDPEKPTIEIKTFQDGEVCSVALNDTLIGARDVHMIFWTEDGAEVHWSIHEVQAHNYGYTFLERNFGSQIKSKIPNFGIYRVELREYDDLFSEIIHTFFIKIEGVPGKIGDEEENSFIFRMEIKKGTYTDDFLFIYFKYTGNYMDHFFIDMNDPSINHYMNKFQYSSEPYYYYILPIESGTNKIKFMYLEEGGQFFMSDQNMIYSSFYGGDHSIEFHIP